MKSRTHGRPTRFRCALILVASLTVLMCGCPIDTDALATDVVQATLQSITDSLVDALSTFLAGT